MISPAFVKANYKILESLLRDWRRQIRNEDLRTKLEYFSEDYDEEREMEPRPGRTREVTPPLRTRSPRVRRQRERVVGFEEAPNREGSRTGRNTEGNRPLKDRAEENGRREMNLPPLLAAHLKRNENGQPLQSSLTSVYEVHMYPMDLYLLMLTSTPNPLRVLLMDKPQAALSKLRLVIPPLGEPLSTLYKDGLFADPTGSVTPFVHWIEDYPLPDGLKMPFHVASKRGSRRRTWQFTSSNKEKARVSKLSPLDHGHDTNQCRELRHQIEEAVKSGQLAHLVKGIKRKREKVSDTQLGEWKKERRNAEPVETFVLMISRRSCNPRKRYVEEDYNKVGEITFPPLSDKSSVDQSS
ncbi:hypothetical protein Tco_1076760 [Tanacetum coccineum]